MKYTSLGLPLPDAGDCAACVFGNEHNSDCVGVDFDGKQVYYSGVPSIMEQSKNIITRITRD